ncbi:cytochrome c oxidase assembly protein [Aquimonas sp.]|jgi:cytochrome c oxidase assembly protein subunit 11|uniref:cytochrome c oxidase assembly protein n=1 Tax=Aquimonas sp. TaxID=1872588 RepID=UPI0037C02D51
MSANESAGTSRLETRKLLGRAALACGMAFLFAFSLVPLYRIACEKVFGIKLEQTATGETVVASYAVDESRLVTVEFDTGVNSQLNWQFRSDQLQMQVHPGKMYEAMFHARNMDEQAIVGQAVPSVAPARASIFFNKTECFCFTEQLLNPGEERPMPVRFVVDPALPPEITTLTLSYTFFNNEHATARIAAHGGAH